MSPEMEDTKLTPLAQKCTAVMRVSILLAVVLYPIASFFFYLGFFIALLAWIISLFGREGYLSYLMGIPLIKPLLFLLGISFLSIFWSLDFVQGLDGWGKVLQAVLSYVMLYEALISLRTAKWALIGVTIAFFATSSYGILGDYLGWEARRVTSFFSNPNPLAGYLVLVSFLILGIVFSRHFHWGFRIYSGIAFVLGIWTVFLTMTRGAWVALPLGFLAFFILMGFKNWKYLVIPLIFLVFLGTQFLDVVDIPVVSESIVRRAETILDMDNARLRIWARSWEIFKDHPLGGVGIGNFSEAYIAYGSEGDSSFDHAHNLPVHLTVVLGIWGPIFLVWFVLDILRLQIPRLLRASPENRAILAGCLASLAAIMGHTLTHLVVHIRGLVFVLLFIILIGWFFGEREKAGKPS